jgi:hypothetical protein
MVDVFPNSNLATASQPWGREVQKRVTNLESQFALQRTNGATVDAQLQSSYRRLDETVKGLLQADIDINSALTLANKGIADAASAASAAQTAANEAAAAASTANTAANTANTAINGLIGLGSDGSSYTLRASNITSGGVRDGVLTLSSGSNSSITLFNGGVDIYGPSAQVRVGTAGNGGITIDGQVAILGGNLRAPGITSTQFLQAENHAGGGTTGASINNNGTIIRTSSSERYKQDIENLQVSYEDVLTLQPKRFRLKDEAAENTDARYYAGFIAEEIDQTSLKDFVAYQTLEDGTKRPDGVYYGELTAALLEAIKHQDALIKSLTDRIVALESDKV